MGVPTINTSTWFGSGTASTAVLTPAQVSAVAPLVRVTAAYVVMYYAFCFFQSWSKLYLSASRRPTLLFLEVDGVRCPRVRPSLRLRSLEPTDDRLRSPRPTAQPMAELTEPTYTPSTRYAIDAIRHRRDAADAIRHRRD
jgi:hypothetical protein